MKKRVWIGEELIKKVKAYSKKNTEHNLTKAVNELVEKGLLKCSESENK